MSTVLQKTACSARTAAASSSSSPAVASFTSTATPRPGILSLIRMTQRQKVQEYGLGDDYDGQWDFFCVFCEMMRTMLLNKVSCEKPHEVQPFTQAFESATCDSDRVHLLLCHPDSSSIVKYFAREFSHLGTDFGPAFCKSDAMARSCRLHADKLMQSEKFRDAGRKYSQGIQFARGLRGGSAGEVGIGSAEATTGTTVVSPNDQRTEEWSEQSRCFASRSLCLFRLKDMQSCIHDVDMALEDAVIPSDERAELLERKLLCLKSLGRMEEAEHAFRHIVRLESKTASAKTTDYPANGSDDVHVSERLHPSHQRQQEGEDSPLTKRLAQVMRREVPILAEEVSRQRILTQIQEHRRLRDTSRQLVNASPKIRVSQSPSAGKGGGRGRFLTAGQPISKGEPLISESPVVSWLRPSLYPDYCFHCMRQLVNHHLVPCSTCALVAYCSVSCRSDSWSQYHQLECPHLPILRHLSKGHVVSRLLMRRRLESTRETNNDEERSASNGSGVIDWQQLDRLTSHSNDYPFTTRLETSLGACFMAFLLQTLGLTDCGSSGSRDTIEQTAARLLTHLLQLNVNCLQVVQQDIVTDGNHGTVKTLTPGISYRVEERSENPGYGLYLTSSLLNHSCYNTTKSFFSGNYLTFVASTDFQSGEEITFNYGPHFKVTSRTERRKYLKDLYFFTCDCKACHNDWR